MENAPRKVVRLDPLSLPSLDAVAAEADPAITLWNRIKTLRKELDAAAEWRKGTPWWCDRELEMRLNLTTLARISPGHLALPANVISI